MANANRASMREGPLAALFRKTEEPGAEPAERAAPAPQAPPEPAPAVHPRESGIPHPALSASPPAAESRPHIPTPQERLRHAFSSEIPENIMDRPATHAGRAEYAREEPSPLGTPASPASPSSASSASAAPASTPSTAWSRREVEGIEFLAVNTDLQSLQQSTADLTLHIGEELTRGRGSGSDANVGRQAAMEDYDRIKSLLKGSDMVFITAGAAAARAPARPRSSPASPASSAR